MCRFLVCCLVCVIVLLSRLCDCVAVSPAAWSHSCHLPSPSRHSQKSDMASNDPGWQYGTAVEGKGNQKMICTFCNKTTKGGITRHKHHLAGDSAQVLKCPRVPIEIQKLFIDASDKKKQDKEATNKIPHFDDDVVDIDEDEEATTNSEFFQ